MSTSLSYAWNLGSILGLTLISQLATGLLLVLLYTPDSTLAFPSVEYIIREINSGWLLRILHFNGASLMLLCLFLHIGRGIIFASCRIWNVWVTGIILFTVSIAEAFIGYVLPWGQMSVWGACVITSLLSVLPFIGEALVLWVWGGLVVNSSTLGCFFTLHYLLPLVLLGLVGLHLLFLHETGSTTSSGSTDSDLNVNFFPLFVINDSINLSIFFAFVIFCLVHPFSLGDCENFNEANLMNSPVHIQPEWYLLLLYAILRAIPNNLGGVIALAAAVLALLFLPLLPQNSQSNINSWSSITTSVLVILIFGLTWLGACPVEAPFVLLSQILSILYLVWFLLWSSIFLFLWWIINNDLNSLLQ